MKKTSHNPWKIAFLTLISTIIIGLFIALMLMITPSHSPKEELSSPSTEQPFTVSATPKQVSALVNQLLKKEDASMHFTLGKTSELQGTIQVLGKDVSYTLWLAPQVTKNGNLILEAKKVKAGQLRLPLTVILAAFEHTHHIPNWMNIDAMNHTISINFAKIPINDFRLAIQSINWQDNRLIFNLYSKAEE